jgi:hypothetical protein
MKRRKRKSRAQFCPPGHNPQSPAVSPCFHERRNLRRRTSAEPPFSSSMASCPRHNPARLQEQTTTSSPLSPCRRRVQPMQAIAPLLSPSPCFLQSSLLPSLPTSFTGAVEPPLPHL